MTEFYIKKRVTPGKETGYSRKGFILKKLNYQRYTLPGMGKNKLKRYADNVGFDNVIEHTDFKEKEPPAGRWAEQVFGNNNPIVLELACGKGEYTTNLARLNPDKNYIGLDIKGDRIWKGAHRAMDEGLDNVRFLRCFIDHLDLFFGEQEITEIWITFPDPFLRKSKWKKRLTSPRFLSIYRRVALPEAVVHLKTDSSPLFNFTEEVVENQGLPVLKHYSDLYEQNPDDPILSIKTYYEKKHLQVGRTIQYIQFRLNN